jgi:hypothetical protein
MCKCIGYYLKFIKTFKSNRLISQVYIKYKSKFKNGINNYQIIIIDEIVVIIHFYSCHC